MNPKVSVVIPVYNVENYLHRCVDSIRCQSLKDIEIILVDDGSPDNCPAMCDEYAQIDSRIKVIHKQNAGLGMACNSGLEVANGDYIAFCDSDDWVAPNMYERMFETACNHKADMVITGLRRVNDLNETVGFLPHKSTFEIYQNDEVERLIKDMIASQVAIKTDREIQVSAKTVLYSRYVLNKHSLKFFSEREFPSEDLLFNVSFMCKARKICVLPNFFYNYFINTNSITSTVKPDHFNKMLGTAKKLIDLTKDFNKSDVDGRYDPVIYRIYRFLIGEARSYSRQILLSDLSSNKKRLEIEALSNNSFLKEISQNYPVKMMPLRHRIPFTLLLRNHFLLLKLLFIVSH